ncbi:monovalent cation/H(+) antiporter subunit G [Devosia sp. 2618]|uniref:monovalent cation/H(+) antiporter subunit G n=1 Tax=Devosia sp. 2618 TaxID=3156454 RepID=UPI003392357E
MISAIAIYAGCIVLLLGAAFSLSAAIGILRLPDLYTRMHAASKAGAVGGGLIFIAIALVSLDLSVTFRAVMGFLFLLITTPVSAHLLARVSYRNIDYSSKNLVIDDLQSKASPKDGHH